MMFGLPKTVFRSIDIVPVSPRNASAMTYGPVKHRILPTIHSRRLFVILKKADLGRKNQA